jgi:hypothetical protein
VTCGTSDWREVTAWAGSRPRAMQFVPTYRASERRVSPR